MPDDLILQWGNPALHETANEVDRFDDLVRAQASRLSRRLAAADGAGLAATQVGSLRSPVQHELDHLDGILTLQRAEPAERHRAIAQLLMESTAAGLRAA